MEHVLRVVFAATLTLIFGLSTALAQDVTLTSRDGSIEVNGTMLGFDGEFYRVQTEYGELTVDGSGVLCDGPGCPNLQAFVAEIDFAGAPEIGQLLLPALLQSFAAKSDYKVNREEGESGRMTYELQNREDDSPVARFHIKLSSSPEGFADLLADQADIVMSTREISREERRLARDAGMGDMTTHGRARVLALDALVAIVSPQNPVSEISVADISEIYRGKVNNWKTLGPQNAPISLYLRDLETGTGQIAAQQLNIENLADLAESIRYEPDNLALATRVSIDPFGLGLVSRATTLDTKSLPITGSCGRSIRATRRNVKTEDYPLTTPLFLYLPARRLPQIAREFLIFTTSPAAQLVIRRAGFVDQAPEEISVDYQGDRLANSISVVGDEISAEFVKDMIATLRQMKRLTTSFRFETGSVRLDAQSRSNVEQLASALEAGIYDGKSLYFVGFSDGEGSAQTNLEISRRRANVVLNAVKKAAETADFEQIDASVLAYGEAMPMACDDTPWGRQVNRRVEVWVR